MLPEELKKNAARSVMHSLVVKEAAPGYAELGLYWHDGLGKKVPLGKYAEEDARWSVEGRGGGGAGATPSRRCYRRHQLQLHAACRVWR